MLLRRVMEHVRDQNWVAVGIDFVIVVIGVFVGIQVANWNQALADERLGQAYTTRLRADLEQDLASRRRIADYYRAVLASVERADSLLEDAQSDPEDLVVNLYRASEVAYAAPSRATWDEIVSAGHTGLLSRELAGSAAGHYAFDTAGNVFNILNTSAYRHRVRSLIPLAVQKALRAGCSDQRDNRHRVTGFMPDCALDVEPGMIAATAGALRDDPAVRAELRHQYSTIATAHANLSANVVLIEQALGKH